MVIALFFLFGLIVGSFLNVCITRIPEGLSIVSPGSRCPSCGAPIKPYDNIPLLGWFWLRGKCRACGQKISALYPIVELLTALLFVACFLSFGLTLDTFKWLFFTGLLIVLIVTDVRVRLLPDAVNWFGFGLGLALAARIPPIDPVSMRVIDRVPFIARNGTLAGIVSALLGAAAGSLLLLGAAMLYRAVRGREGMGMGDVKMMLMLGTFLGVQGTFLTLLLGTFMGSLVGLLIVAGLFVSGWKNGVARRGSRKGLGSVSALRWTISSRYQLPLGTFLGIAALVVVHFSAWFDAQAYRLMR